MIRFINLLLLLICGYLSAQASIHSHNDYMQSIPFWNAYAHNAKSIEADVFLRNDTLFVAHSKDDICKEATLNNLYLQPIQKIFKQNCIKKHPFYLLIDVKSKAQPTLNKIVKELEGIKKFLYPYNKKGVKIVISGNRPPEEKWKNYPDFIYFDWQSLEKPSSTQKIGMISYDFSQITPWNGKGRLTFNDDKKVKKVITQMKKFKKPIRFWANPNTKSGWKTLVDRGVDLIGTDAPEKLEQYLKDLEKQTVNIICPNQSYTPTYKYDGAKGEVKNIILLIGDGMGVSQISSVMNQCDNLILNKLRNIGFSKTSSANDYVTDSGAGGTAIAIGKKTNNRSIGVDVNGVSSPSLAEIFKANQWNAGIITTDEILGATPADFYAHVKDRGNKKEIIQYLIKSDIDFFAGGGLKYFKENNTLFNLQKNGFEVINSIAQIQGDSRKLLYLGAEDGMDYIREGRGNWLAEVTKAALNYLDDKPFFLMIEGAQIDNFGHFNDTKGIVEETIDFNLAVQEAIKYADTHPSTLVVITADHETGGFSIPHGNLKKSSIEGAFTTHDHSATMVPVFAYGAGAEEFKGVYQNNEIFNKILKLIKSNF